jgi:hypothetical protein
MVTAKVGREYTQTGQEVLESHCTKLSALTTLLYPVLSGPNVQPRLFVGWPAAVNWLNREGGFWYCPFRRRSPLSVWQVMIYTEVFQNLPDHLPIDEETHDTHLTTA